MEIHVNLQMKLIAAKAAVCRFFWLESSAVVDFFDGSQQEIWRCFSCSWPEITNSNAADREQDTRLVCPLNWRFSWNTWKTTMQCMISSYRFNKTELHSDARPRVLRRYWQFLAFPRQFLGNSLSIPWQFLGYFLGNSLEIPF